MIFKKILKKKFLLWNAQKQNKHNHTWFIDNFVYIYLFKFEQ